MNAIGDVAVPGVLQRSRVRRGALAFVVLTAAGLAALFAFGRRDAVAGWAGELRPVYLALALASALADVVLSAWRYQIFIRVVRPGTPLSLAIRADLAGRFLGAVTPSQSGGGPAQVFVLRRGGVPVPHALAFLLINLMATVAFFVPAGTFAAWLFRGRFAGGAMGLLIRYGFVMSLCGFGLMLTALLRPDLVSRPVQWLARRGEAGGARWAQRLARVLADSLDQYRGACALFLRAHPWLPVASFGLAVLLYLDKFTCAWLVMRGLGVDPDLGTTLALMALLHFSVYVAPTPGGSGIAEVATGAFVSILMPAPLLGPFTLCHRLLAVYLPALVGAVILMAELRPGKQTRSCASATKRLPALARAGSAWSCRVPLVVMLALAAAHVAADPRAGHAAERAAAVDVEVPDACPLCDGSAPVPTPLQRVDLEQAAQALAARNSRELAAIDGLLRAGRFGAPASREARGRAQLLARLVLANWYSFLLPFVEDEQRVFVADPAAVGAVLARFCEAAAVPAPRLRELRLGRGRLCARYDLVGAAEQGWTTVGGRRLGYRVADVSLGGRSRRVLSLDWGSTAVGSSVEVLVAEHYGFRLERGRRADGEGSYDVYLAQDVAGAWVRRFGVHRPAGFSFWTTPLADGELPAAPRVGSAIYLPGLRFTLPLLPDVDLDDVRVLALPMPFLDAEELRRGAVPAWFASAGELTVSGWTTLGSVPPAVRASFPDR